MRCGEGGTWLAGRLEGVWLGGGGSGDAAPRIERGCALGAVGGKLMRGCWLAGRL